jgi:hypothetical protein
MWGFVALAGLAVAGWTLAFKFWRAAEEQSAENAVLRQQVYEGLRGVPGLLGPDTLVQLTRAGR